MSNDRRSSHRNKARQRELLEVVGIAPTGRRATITVMDFVRYEDGKVVEHWNIVDQLGLMQQLGAV